MEFNEKAPLEWFGKEISNHLRGRTVFNSDFPTVCPVSHEIVSYIDVPCPFTAGGPTILLHKNGTLIVLIYNAIVDVVVTEFRQPLQVQSHLEMTGILVQLGHIQRT